MSVKELIKGDIEKGRISLFKGVKILEELSGLTENEAYKMLALP
tara:strand:+ start:605 stop:736 length:132 start_codon:yes stop_codon:yes gene_type:complete